eukprot:91859-Pyramimonas_sp.AAC.1
MPREVHSAFAIFPANKSARQLWVLHVSALPKAAGLSLSSIPTTSGSRHAKVSGVNPSGTSSE